MYVDFLLSYSWNLYICLHRVKSLLHCDNRILVMDLIFVSIWVMRCIIVEGLTQFGEFDCEWDSTCICRGEEGYFFCLFLWKWMILLVYKRQLGPDLPSLSWLGEDHLVMSTKRKYLIHSGFSISYLYLDKKEDFWVASLVGKYKSATDRCAFIWNSKIHESIFFGIPLSHNNTNM